MKPALLSVVFTVYNTRDSIRDLIAEIADVAEGLSVDYEIVVADDRCPQNSWEVLQEIAASNKRVRALRLSRNYGQQIAMSAGIAASRGDAVVIMDGDLQNPTAKIPEILASLEQGNEVVYLVASARNNWFHELTSRIFWFLLTRIFGVEIVKNQIMMKGLSRRVADQYGRYAEKCRTVAGIVMDIGCKTDVLEVKNRKRKYGSSSYSLAKRIDLMVEIVISMSDRPLKGVIHFALGICGLSILFGLVRLLMYFSGVITPGYTSVVLLITFFFSTLLLAIGVVGEYLGILLKESRQRPLYFVDSKVNIADEL